MSFPSCLWLSLFCPCSYFRARQALSQSHEVYFSIIPNFNKVIAAILLIRINTLSLPMSLLLKTILCSLPTPPPPPPPPSFGVLSLPLLFFVLNTSSTPQPLQVYTRHLLTNTRPPPDSSPMAPSSTTPILPSLDDLHIAIQKGIRSSRNPHLIYNFLTYHRLSSPYSASISTLSSISLPKSVQEALSNPGWKQAMVEEMATLHYIGT